MTNHNNQRPAIELDERAALRRSDPLLILFKLSAIIFIAEFVVMMALPKLTLRGGLLSWFLDAALLAVVSLPIVYLWFLRPLGRSGALCRLAVFGGVIFASEVIVMGLLSFLQLQAGPLEALFDAALLTAICFPPIHWIMAGQGAAGFSPRGSTTRVGDPFLGASARAEARGSLEVPASRSDFGPAAAKRLTRLYISALSLIAFVSIAAQLLNQYMLAQDDNITHVINVAGRQRMLSQKLAKTALAIDEITDHCTSGTLTKYNHCDEKPERLHELKAVLGTWADAHRGLQKGDSALGLCGHNSPEIQARFALLQPHFDEMFRSGQALLQSAADGRAGEIAKHSQRIMDHESLFLKGMSDIVVQYDVEARDRMQLLQRAGLAVVAVVLLMLVLQGALIFRPFAGLIRRQFAMLQASEERTRLIVETAPDAVIGMDAEGRIIGWNPQAEATFGWPAAEVIGHSLGELIIPSQHRAAHERGLRHFLGTGEGSALNQRLEVTALNRAGHEFPVELTVSALRCGDTFTFSAFVRDLTDQKEAEEESSRLGRILDGSSNEIYIFDAEMFRFTHVNLGARRNLGYSMEEMKRLTPFDLKPNLPRAQLAKVLDSLRAGGEEQVHFETEHRRKDGSLYPVEVRLQLSRSESSPVFVAIIQDITKRKQSEEALRQSEERFDLAVSGSSDGLWDWPNLQEDAEWWSPRFYELLGYEEGEIEASHAMFLELLHPDDVHAVSDAVRAHFVRRVPFDIEYRLRTKTGEYRWFRSRGRAVWDENGDPVRMAGSIQDISERKATEKELVKLAAFPQQDPFPVIEIDRGDRVSYVNPAAERAFPNLCERGLKHTILESLSSDFDSLRRGYEASYTREIEYDGATYVQKLCCVPEEGLIRIYFHAVTEIRQAEVELRQAKEVAESANKAKSEFLANMSHEIRTPMTAILGFSDLLGEVTENNPACLDYVNTIKRNGEHLVTIINDILDLSKIEAGRFDCEVIACSPHEIINGVASTMRYRAQEKGLELVVEYSGSIPALIQTDPTRFQQTLMNLVGNAVKFTEQGSVKMCVGLVGSDADKQLLVEVVDTGIGIPPDRLDSVFEAFRQADTSTTREFGGTGLGLTITKQIAELLGGSLEVRSEVGKGSVFSLRVATGPLTGVEFIDQPVEESTPERRTEKRTDTPELDCHILLAEDGPDNQRLITFVLEKAGAHVTLAENGEEAFDKGMGSMHHRRAGDPEHPFDVILMDMQMPVMDGCTATRKLRDNGYTRPIIALTANAMAGDREKCIQAGCDDFVTKPIDRAQLLRIIQDYAASDSALVEAPKGNVN